MEITAVAMCYYGDHKFLTTDNIILEKEYNNPHDVNAIKVLVDNVHVAYICREDAIKLRQINDFERYSVTFVCNNIGGWSAKLSILVN